MTHKRRHRRNGSGQKRKAAGTYEPALEKQSRYGREWTCGLEIFAAVLAKTRTRTRPAHPGGFAQGWLRADNAEEHDSITASDNGLLRNLRAGSWHTEIAFESSEPNKRALSTNQGQLPWFCLTGPNLFPIDPTLERDRTSAKLCLPPCHFELVVVGASLVVINSDDGCIVVIAARLL